MRSLWRFLIGQAVLVVLLLLLPWAALAVFPGALEVTAPVLCPTDQPDARVVQYTVDADEGTATNATLVCLGPDGDLTEVGTWAPLGLFFAILFVGSEALVLPIQLVGMVRRR